MLFDRKFNPTDSLLYHYCSPDAFLAICSNKTVRFSDIYSMNDFMEMHWGYHMWEQTAGKVLEKLGKEFLDSIDEIISSSSCGVLPLAACFSKGGDVLSQWRAYADNGAGFCIGFKAGPLCQLAARPLEVLYDSDQQEKEIGAFLAALHEVHSKEPDNMDDFFTTCGTFACDLAALKNPSFAEESEVRLIHVANFVQSNRFLKLQDFGGTAFGGAAEPQPVKFVMRGSVPVPYIDLSFIDPDGNHPIAEVILGPKNDGLPTAISIFLETCDLGDVLVKRSKASYR